MGTHFVEMLERQDDLGDVDAHLVLGKLFPLVEMSKQLAAAHVICRNEEETKQKGVLFI